MNNDQIEDRFQEIVNQALALLNEVPQEKMDAVRDIYWAAQNEINNHVVFRDIPRGGER